jgi:hypothetical protein
VITTARILRCTRAMFRYDTTTIQGSADSASSLSVVVASRA